MTCRQVQKEPDPSWTRPRRARWKAWEWTFARPGSVRPSNRTASSGGSVTLGVTATKRPFFTSRTTSGAVRAPPSQAWRAHQVGMKSGTESGDQGSSADNKLLALKTLVLLPCGEG